MIRPRSILVTGATGFVGTALLARLHRDGHVLRAACRTPRPAARAAVPPGVSWHAVGAIGPDTPWQDALTGVEAVIHLAARVHVMAREDADAVALYRTVNTEGTLALARAAAAAGVRRLVFVSSIKAVGGDTADRPLSEAVAPAPDSPYGVSKWEAEQGLRQIGATTGLETVILRPPLVFGPGVKGNFRRLLGLCRTGLPLPLGGLDNRRSLIARANLVDALALSATHPDAAGQTFHVADEPALSTADLIRRIRSHMGRPACLPTLPAGLLSLAAASVGGRAAWTRLAGSLELDSRHIRDRLGWTPPVGLDTALAETVRAYTALG